MNSPLSIAVAGAARRLDGSPSDFELVLSKLDGCRFVLIGEASHGTHEFYRVRAELTKRLIRERGFAAVAVEADWPDAYRVNRYVRGRGDDADAELALSGFERFPQWMWRNADVLDFVGWLRAFNDDLAPESRVGFYGLDLYSLHRSMNAVVGYLDVVDPAAAERARRRYACFEDFDEDPQHYGHAAVLGLTPSCERAVTVQLMELQRSAAKYALRDGRLARDDGFFAEQNARLVVDAERYYRSMFGDRVSSWNLRDRHMASTLESIAKHLGADALRAPKLVVWAHNSHLGDARSTSMADAGELNLGQLVREQHGGAVVSVGFTTHSGTVTAASDWGAPAECKRVRDSLPHSWERLFHDLGLGNFSIDSTRVARHRDGPFEPLLERAIGVIYRPETERVSHYFRADLPRQFDVLLHYDRTRAVEPLERSAVWEHGELPDTYPSTL